MKLSAYAKKLGISYQTAWNHYKAGYIPNAKKLPSGIIVIEEEATNTPERTAVYARVSSTENKVNLLGSSGFRGKHTALNLNKLLMIC